ncbi:6-carboxytetrahydropterin synthase QueD [Aquihabitans sp. McL0605]|uniref:6-carboxytetrahydropterin synthase QueD n=1 Tax=Aquihabitans sp. McL0605 TaxID=3415671 RepID=UPI003CE8C0F8
MEIYKRFTFEAAHHLPNVAPGHKCARVHGHGYQVTITVTGPVGAESGWVADFADLSAAFASVLSELDHHDLNGITGLENPTAEVLAIWIWDRLAPALPGLSAVDVAETPTSGAIYRGPAT